MFCGTVVSFLVPETKRQTLEVLAGEAPLPKSRGTSPILQEMEAKIPRENVKAWKLNLWDKKKGRRKEKDDKDIDVGIRRVRSEVSMSTYGGTLRFSGMEREFEIYRDEERGDLSIRGREMDIGDLALI